MRVQADWAEEQSSRTEEFQRELLKQTEIAGDLNAEKVSEIQHHSSNTLHDLRDWYQSLYCFTQTAALALD